MPTPPRAHARPTTTGSAPPPADGSERPPRAGEPARRLIHIGAALAAAAVAWLSPPASARAILTAALGLAVVIDLARRRPGAAFGRAFDRSVGSMLRAYERRRWTGATVLAAGFALAAWIVPPSTAAVAFLIAGLADPAAALAGRRLGRVRTPWGKSIAGTVAFVVVGAAIVIGLPAVDPLSGLLAVLAAAAVEAAPIDDNLGVPVIAALILHAFGAVS